METYIPQSAQEWIEIFFRRKKLFLAPFLLVISATIFVYPLLPRVYEAKTTLLAEGGDISNPLDRVDDRRSSLQKRVKLLQAHMLSWSNLGQLIVANEFVKPSAGPDDVEKMAGKIRKRLGIDLESQGLVELTYEDEDPDRAQKLSNIMADDLVRKNQNLLEQEARSRIEFIEDQLRIYKDKLENSETSFLASKIKAQLDEAVKKREILARQMIPTSSSLQGELSRAEADLRRLMMDAKSEHPLVQDLKDRVDRLKTAIASERARGIEDDGDIATTNPAYQEAQIKRLELIKEIDIEVASLRKKLQSLRRGERLFSADASDQELLAMERDKRVNEDIYQSLLMSLENANIAQRLGDRGRTNSIEILDRAKKPGLPSKPDPLKTAAAGFGLALASGFCLVFLREYFDSSFRGIDDAEAYVDLRLLGHIPKLDEDSTPAKPNTSGWIKSGSNGNGRYAVAPNIVAYHKPETKASEQYRLLRSNILNIRGRKNINSILFTSTLAGEGKTTTIVNLAVSIAAETRLNVLLIDADLRRGNLAPPLGLHREKGLTDYLQGKLRLDSIYKDSPVPNLTVITSGATVANPSRLLDSSDVKNLFAEAKKKFDLILVDSPPALEMADVSILAHQIDGVLFVVQAGKTRRELIRHLKKNITVNDNIHVLGYVLTQLESKIPAYLNPYVSAGYYY